MLLFSLVGLVVGPMLHRAARGSSHATASLDGFALVAISGLVVLHIMPEGVREAGWLAFVAAAAGFFLPGILERGLHRAAETTHRAALAVAMFGLAIHAALDGAALAQPGHHLALAVVLHRLPVGLAIWLLLGSNDRYGRATLTLGAVAAATIGGFYLGGDLPRGYGLAIFESLIGGSLMHVVLHRSTLGDGRGGWKLGAGAGALAGLALLWWIGDDHSHGDHMAHSATSFMTLAQQSAGPLLLAYLGASLLHAFMPRSTIGWLGRGPAIVQASKGVAFGLPLPICSCGVVPLYQSLIEKGAPPVAAMAFLVATPEIGIDAVLLSLPFLGLPLTLIRLGAAGFIALTAGLAIGRITKTDPARVEATPATATEPLTQRITEGLRAGFFGLVDNTAAWILVGLGIAAVGTSLLDPAWVARLPRGLDVLVLAAIGIPTYVCASGATPLAGMLLAKGVSPGASLAFLLTGPATNATTFGILSRLHDRRVAVAFGLLVGGLAISIGIAINPLLGANPDTFLSQHGHEHATESVSWLTQWATWTLAGLFALSILRQGPRAFLGHVFPMALYDHGHSHGDGDDHDHHDDSSLSDQPQRTCEKPSCCGCPPDSAGHD